MGRYLNHMMTSGVILSLRPWQSMRDVVSKKRRLSLAGCKPRINPVTWTSWIQIYNSICLSKAKAKIGLNVTRCAVNVLSSNQWLKTKAHLLKRYEQSGWQVSLPLTTWIDNVICFQFGVAEPYRDEHVLLLRALDSSQQHTQMWLTVIVLKICAHSISRVDVVFIIRAIVSLRIRNIHFSMCLMNKLPQQIYWPKQRFNAYMIRILS